MFDPSKIILNDNNKNEDKSDSKIKKEDSKTKKILDDVKKEKAKSEKLDILGNLNVNKKVEKNSKKPELKEEIKREEKTIFDVNIKSFDDILVFLSDKNEKYDFVTFEPDDTKVKITFRKKSSVPKIKYIKYNIYSIILIKVKSATKLHITENQKTQDGKGNIDFLGINYDISSKVVPSNFGENLFVKISEKSKSKKQIKKEKKSNISQMFSFLGAVFFILLIVGGGILSFIVVNAKTVEDVKFFNSFGINLNDVNNIIGNIVFFIFSILTFILLIFLVIFLFKFFITKKEFKKKKTKYAILAILLFLLTFGTASSWMFIDKKVRELPEWGEMIRGEVQLFDNAKLKSKNFTQNDSFFDKQELLNGIIGPVQIKFNAEVLKNKESQNGKTIKQYNWTFSGPDGKEEIIETSTEIIKDFDKKGITEVKLSVLEIDSLGNESTKDVNNISTIKIKEVVKIIEKPQETGGKMVTIDATSLKSEGEANWYLMDNLKDSVNDTYLYSTSKPIFEETFIGLSLVKNGEEKKTLDKVFIIKGKEKTKLNANITYEIDTLNDLKYSFKASEINLDSGAGIVEKFIWTIGKKDYTRDGVYGKMDDSSEIEHIFENYGKQKIILKIIDSNGNEKVIKKEIDVNKDIYLQQGLEIKADGRKISDITYNSKLKEYNIRDLGIPTKLNFSAEKIRLKDPLYYLENVSWDFNGDGDTDEVGREVNYELFKTGRTKIIVSYDFKNRKSISNTLNIVEEIYINTVEKDAIIDFEIKKDSDYVPVKIGFDASLSKVKNKNISKFIWDFGDGTSEERDSIIPAHRYTTAGDYTIKLIVVTEDGDKYSIEKKLILKPTPQKIEIEASMKKAPSFQEIDFYSSSSSGDIISYFWDFGDSITSTEANPSHMYKTPGNYKVKLILNFRNNNVMEKVIDIVIY